MDIAKAKRRENIAEYILYLWQLEDLLRALQFSPEAIFSTLIAPRKDIGEEQKHVFLLWYMDLANLLRQEGKEEKGHLEHTLHLIQDLHDLHLQLMKLPVGAQCISNRWRTSRFFSSKTCSSWWGKSHFT